MRKNRLLQLTIAFLLASTNVVCAQTLPIKVARTISFTTTEGSYMNVNVSPDGKMLAFDLLGDLYTMPSTGGFAKQLTRGMALHARPVWSPDSKKLAYIADETGSPQLHIMATNDNFQLVLSHISCTGWIYQQRVFSSDAVWSRDGRYIGFMGKYYEIDGKQLQPPFNLLSPLRFSTGSNFAWGIDSGRIIRYDLKTGVSLPLTGKLPQFLNGAISPDGRWWCYLADVGGRLDYLASRRKLIALNLDSHLSRVLIENFVTIDPQYKSREDVLPHFSFSPDSKNIYIGYGGKIHRIEIESGSDKVIPFKARVNVDMGAYDYHTHLVGLKPFDIKYARSASASPDGKHLVFTALNRIYIMNLPNGKPHVLCPQNFGQFQPAWSPDGKWIAYTSWNDTDGGFLWKVAVNGEKPLQLTKVPGQYQRPTWSLNGDQIAVLQGANKLNTRDPYSIGKLELVTASGGGVNLIADSVPVLYNLISFSPDGKQLFYSPGFKFDKVFQSQLISQDISSGLIKTVVTGEEAMPMMVTKSLSPDGRFLVCSADEDLYIMPMTNLSNPEVLSRSKSGLAGIRFASGVDPVWENGGKILAWTYGNKFFSINSDKVIAAAEKANGSRNLKDTVAGAPVTIEITPDQTISLKVIAHNSYANGIIALRNARILTMNGNRVIDHGTILEKNGRITAIGPVSVINIPKNAKIIELSGKTIMPGLIDLHLHMYEVSPEIFSQQCWQFLASLAYGVTTARDPSMSFDSFGYAELLRSGQVIGPRLYTVGRAVRLTDGVLSFESAADADAVVQKRFLLGGSEIKQYFLPTRLQREWLIQACEKYGMNMTNEGNKYPLLQLGMIKDGTTGIEHNAVFGDIYNDEIQLRAKASSYLTPTLQVSYTIDEAQRFFDYKYWRYPDKKWLRFVAQPGDKIISQNDLLVRNIPIPKDTLSPLFLTPAHIDARIRKAGGSIVMGSHGNSKGAGPHNELWALQAGGLTNMEALQEATIDGAKALGIQKDLGSLEVGKIADLLVLDKNPLDDIHNSRSIRYVMQGGILYDANTLDEIWPVRKKCPEWKMKGQVNANTLGKQIKEQGIANGENDND